MSDKKPRLFYFEDAVDAWCPADNLDVENIISIDSFYKEEEIIEIQFKRIDMTDAELAALPED